MEKNYKALKKCTNSPAAAADRLSALPHELVLSILSSSLTTKEAARLSILSQKFNDLWRHFRVLTFQDDFIVSHRLVDLGYRVIDRYYRLHHVLKRPVFIDMVNGVLERHIGPYIDQLTIFHDLDKSFQSHVDNWVVFAFKKQVKKLELIFLPVIPTTKVAERPTLKLECVIKQQPPDSPPCLTSLNLRFVNVSEEVIMYVLDSCPLLENLRIHMSEDLTGLRLSNPVQLKRLELIDCHKLEIVDISSAPKLLEFTLLGLPPTELLRIKNAPVLSKVSLAGDANHFLTRCFDSLSEYFPRLEFLVLNMRFLVKLNLNIPEGEGTDPPHFPTLVNLKHLEVRVLVPKTGRHILLEWSYLIDASPLLNKLTFKLDKDDSSLPLHNYYYDDEPRSSGRPIKCLETFEYVGFEETSIDLSFIWYVTVHAADTLKAAIIHFVPGFRETHHILRRVIPDGVQLIVKLPAKPTGH